MDRIEKIKQYLRIFGYSEDRIGKILANPKHCNAIYTHIVAYERETIENSIQTHEKLNSVRKR